jgi:lipopolysaccharide transport system ATP-binding protein
MIDLAFENVSKKYIIRHSVETDSRYKSRLGRIFASQGRQEFWAVRDLSFHVKRGETLGIIGPNGAGKSTILKLLSRITAPTAGRVTINGKLSALIEVGSGFHPDLTGRENVYLSGSILGMRRSEITKKFDNIVEFAGLKNFIDTPVKRYSSGMYVRLGFAIAAQLEPDILLLDEVLAVGDASFKVKCLDRIRELEDSGTTIIFISHDLDAVKRLCDRVLLIDHGQVLAEGDPAEVIDKYQKGNCHEAVTAFQEWPDLEAAPGDDVVRLSSVQVCSRKSETLTSADIRYPVGFKMTYEVRKGGLALVPSFHVYHQTHGCIFKVHDTDPAWKRRPRPIGRYVSTVWIPGNFLSDGFFTIGVAISTHDPYRVHCSVPTAMAFSVIDNFEGDAARGDYTGPMSGAVRPMLKWNTQFEAQAISHLQTVQE